MQIRQLTKRLFTGTALVCGAVFGFAANAHEHGPAAPYELLKKDVGSWSTETRIWSAPDAEPLVSQGSEECRMLGKYWLIYEFEGSMAGQPFSGYGNLGYDAKRKKYIGTWVESTGPELSLHEGNWDDETKSFIMYSVARDPSAKPDQEHKMVSTYQDEDHRTFELYEAVEEQENKWRKLMEIKYTRLPSEAE